MEQVDLNFIARQLERVIEEQARQRDDITVLTGITIRLEGSVQGLTTEIRGLRSKVDRMERRLDQVAAAVERITQEPAG
ncbi:MAG: hypothetical protein KDF64_16670 [Geminicoccaceae bacterium]|nr:hypothetical protein [Geminicoccaceae bacterium]